MGGGGVDGAIHRAGGPKILEECKTIVSKIGRLPAGEAVLTSGGNLKARYVIHTVGPIWRGGKNGEKEILKSCYLNSLKVAVENEIKSLAFPSISTGAYRFPVEEAAEVAIKTVSSYVRENKFFEEIRIVLFSREDLERYSIKAKCVLGDINNLP